MRNVIALQGAFEDARRTYPDLIIEACMSGGKMLNEFTDQISQIHWIRDGARSGYIHAITNIHEALGSVSFLDPAKVQRWTNRIDELEPDNDELLKLYCRSCMIGSWGISTDLEKISPKQKSAIISEIKNYRQLNEVKKYNLAEYSFPNEYAGLVPIVYYNDSFTKAGIVVYRILNNSLNDVTLNTRLMPDKTYSVYDVDANLATTVKGNNVKLKLKPDQQSAIFFITEIVSNIENKPKIN